MIRAQRQRSMGRGGGWDVYVDAQEFPNVPADQLVRIGVIGPLGSVFPRRDFFRVERILANGILARARQLLIDEGQLRDPDVSPRVWEPAEPRPYVDDAGSGSFVVELDSGEARSFNAYKTETPNERGTSYFRPGAIDWAEDQLIAKRARHADVFRAPISGPRRAIYKPHILPPRDGHPAMIISLYEYLPLQQLQGPRGYFGTTPEIARAYDAKRNAMGIVDDVIFRSNFAIRPSDIADAWDVAQDAFIEAGLPLQEKFAYDNARYWRKRAGGVSSRQPVVTPKKKRS